MFLAYKIIFSFIQSIEDNYLSIGIITLSSNYHDVDYIIGKTVGIISVRRATQRLQTRLVEVAAVRTRCQQVVMVVLGGLSFTGSKTE